MKPTRKNKWLPSLVLAVPLLLWGERERRISTLTGGIWQVGRKGNVRIRLRFHRDGTGEQMRDWPRGYDAKHFTYKFIGLSRLQITGDKALCGTEIAFSGAMCTASDDLQDPVPSNDALLSFGFNRNYIYLTNAKTIPHDFTWQCVDLAKP